LLLDSVLCRDPISPKPGTPLPKPKGVFPRYVEPGAEAAKGKKG